MHGRLCPYGLTYTLRSGNGSAKLVGPTVILGRSDHKRQNHFQMKKRFRLLGIGRSLALFLGLAGATIVVAQRNCGTMEYLQQQMEADPDRAARLQDIDAHAVQFAVDHDGEERAVVTIPVVFHVVYSTSAQNISDARLIAQLDQLNADYARMNTDAGSTPSVFQGVAANTQVQFCLAQRDPGGNATTGIVRRSTTVSSWSTNDAVKYISSGGSDAWPRDSYLNIWVCNLGSGLLGYAQFPGGAAATDGVVVLFSAVGGMSTPGTATPYHLGRTLTHEVGHWLNLRHIWGDATCGNDQVSDTPLHNTANYGCPTYPHYSTCTGTPVEMTMNYMDYTDDGCMNMFSTGQSTRMQALFGTGGSRVSLLSSLGCVPPSGATCGTPSGLAAANVTASTATVSWAAVSGALSYNLQYKTAAATTWTTVNTASTSSALSGLVASTTYNFQVQAVCSSSSSAFSATSSFTTSSTSVSCGTPTGLAAGSVTATGAVLSWTAVSGASSYSVQYKLASASTWTTSTTTVASFTLSGLAASSAYNAQVAAVCSGVSSAYSTAINFSTSSATTCTDAWENNNTSGTARTIAVNTNIQAIIGSSSDNDWFKFTNTSSQSRIRIDLTNLPADYDVRLYRGTNTQVGIGQNGGTTSEVIILNTTTVATYYVRVYGYNGAFNASQCYTLRASISGTNFREGELEQEVELEPAIGLMNLYPNPATDKVMLDYVANSDGSIQLQVFDGMGRQVLATQQAVQQGPTTFGLPLTQLGNGVYVIQVVDGDRQFTQRFVVER